MTGEDDPVAVAKHHFVEGRYDDCISSLRGLAHQGGTLSPKVKHNLAICQHLKKDPDVDLLQLLQVLTSGQGDSGDKEEDGDDVERSVELYNAALVHFQMKQYGRAISILERLFKVIEPLEEVLAYKVCFLLVECYLSSYQVEGAAMVVYYLETHIGKKSDNSSSSSSTSDHHKARMHLYKTRLYAQQNCLKACKREIKNVLSVSGTTASSLYLKSEFEYLRSNFKKSSKLLNSSPKSCPSKEHIPTLYYNNFACIHFRLHKFHLSVYYMSKALEENAKAVKAAPSGHHSAAYTVNHYYQILYNYGIMLLHAGKPRAAFECLTKTCTVYANNPRLWLRIAESAIGTVKEEEEDIVSSKSMTVKAIVGSGMYRKTILNTRFQRKFSCASADLLQEGAQPTLTFAALCLKSALRLLPAQAKSVPGLPSCPIKNIDRLRASILCNLAYVWLGLGDPYQALLPAQEVANQRTAPITCRLLGNLYMAEALIMLNRSSDAINCLSPDTIEMVKQTTELPNSASGTTGGKASSSASGTAGGKTSGMAGGKASGAAGGKVSGPAGGKVSGEESDTTSDRPAPLQLTVEELQSTTLLNSVAVFCMRRDFNKAKRILGQYFSTHPDKEVSYQATMLLVYVELKQGNTHAALSILKQQQIQF